MNDRAVALDEVEAAGVPQLADALEMIWRQQVVVGEPQDGLAAGEFERAVPMCIALAGRLRQLERLKARVAERAQRVGRPVAATVAEHEHLLRWLRLRQRAARCEQNGLASVVRRDRNRESGWHLDVESQRCRLSAMFRRSVPPASSSRGCLSACSCAT
jgi:hypothetical protein